MKVSQWLAYATKYIAKLDAEIILVNILGLSDKSEILLKEDFLLNKLELSNLDKYLNRRRKGEPIAYIIGKKEFYKSEFLVDKSVLIPRPESEGLVEEVLKNNDENLRILDVGTGSGCLAISVKQERQGWSVDAVDNSREALSIARRNANNLNAEVKFYYSNLLDMPIKNNYKYDIVIANLPYVNPKWNYNNDEINFEPKNALFASDNGMAVIKKFLSQINIVLKKEATVFMECDISQRDALIENAKKYNLVGRYGLNDYLVVLEKQ